MVFSVVCQTYLQDQIAGGKYVTKDRVTLALPQSSDYLDKDSRCKYRPLARPRETVVVVDGIIRIAIRIAT